MTTAVPAPCDSAVLDNARGPEATDPRWTLAATILASSLAFIDGSVVNVSLSAIGHSFGAAAAEQQWAVSAYLLPLSALLLLGGAAGDQFGQRRLLVSGITIFLLASLACAFAPTIGILLAARTVQGIGAAMLMPNSLGILGNSFRGEAKGRAIGTWAAFEAMANAVGPPLGGWLIEVAGWRAIFFLNLPLGLAAIAIAWRYIPNDKGSRTSLDCHDRSRPSYLEPHGLVEQRGNQGAGAFRASCRPRDDRRRRSRWRKISRSAAGNLSASFSHAPPHDRFWRFGRADAPPAAACRAYPMV
ncbi:multidrug resistance protein Stp [Sphingopyxis fribergensis]|uniref:Multidrug resistance protein Stp n=1 Tax=Sphingopyxis fribergensis TaxID=1515612 RepID=A0A0A7PHN5_9SPHN|nr:MFS transporter [Sphingopyxis fribergensis]AJA09515.1 multidrug resistance protein Stp [Sphingopyxis fribergensis]